ncbi:MAG: hypothetical protein RBJ76_18855 [Stenomitos frigidus ULC029]
MSVAPCQHYADPRVDTDYMSALRQWVETADPSLLLADFNP